MTGLLPAAELHVFRSAAGPHLFVADGSRVYDIDAGSAHQIERLCRDGRWPDESLLGALDLLRPQRRIGLETPEAVPLRSISLNVSQGCNMGCTYCYADEGRFGGTQRQMEASVAEATIDRLMDEAEAPAELVLGFMGGEPLLNRPLVHHATRYALDRATRAGHRVRFSMTTNATLVTAEDAALFRDAPFAVQVSLDGPRAGNDRLRPMAGGGGSYDRVLRGLALMDRIGRPRQLTARATVTADVGELVPVLDHLLSLGFDDVGFAPVSVSPRDGQALDPAGYRTFLRRMTECGRRAVTEWQAGRRYPFANLQTALTEIHRGTHRPYPCGAGAAYLSASAEGNLYACHRLIDDPAFAMGSVAGGLDGAARAAHLHRTHVDRAEPCRSCWARYLCGGGCHHEVSRRGRPGCDYVRGWLEFCLATYAELPLEVMELGLAAGGRPR